MSLVQLVDDLLVSYNMAKKPSNPQKLIFEGLKGYDIYNPTAPFEYNGKTIIIGRVERRELEISQAVFFDRQIDGSYVELGGVKRYNLQDPFITKIGSNWVFGGTETFAHPDNPKNLWWRTKFYTGKDLYSLEPLTYGPNGMKDIRLVELLDSKIGVFTRPQGDIGGRGKIGFTVIDKLADLTMEVINNAELLNQFSEEEWGGVNQPILLKDGTVGVLGHIAKFTADGARHYYAMVFKLNPNDISYTPMKIIATRNDFLDGPAKRNDLIDVIFCAGLVLDKEHVTLYAGVSDVEVQCVQIDNPFDM